MTTPLRLHDLGLHYGTDKATYHGYCPFYEQHLPGPEFAGVLVEVGVKDGASLRMWRAYYPHATVIGIDINPMPPIVGCWVLRMDATSPRVLEHLPAKLHVVIDDGSHRTLDQQTTFDLLWPRLVPGGHYVMEDLHTSWWPMYHNAEHRTFDWLRRRFPDAPHWSRTADLSDSVTMVIRKPLLHGS